MMIVLPVTREEAIRHEAGHAAALIALGIRVKSIDVVSNGARGGFTAHDHVVTDRASARA
jgi:hypothetical protein